MWEVETTDVFDKWLVTQSEPLIEDVLAIAGILEERGPHPGRPFVDTVNGSTFPNMKALRVQHAGSPVRIFFAFDPVRRAILLCAGNKKGINEKRFYHGMIRLADSEFANHLAKLEK